MRGPSVARLTAVSMPRTLAPSTALRSSGAPASREAPASPTAEGQGERRARAAVARGTNPWRANPGRGCRMKEACETGGGASRRGRAKRRGRNEAGLGEGPRNVDSAGGRRDGETEPHGRRSARCRSEPDRGLWRGSQAHERIDPTRHRVGDGRARNTAKAHERQGGTG
jgi:hypothetical protein